MEDADFVAKEHVDSRHAVVMAKAAAALRLALITLLLLAHGFKDNGRSRSDTAPTITCKSNKSNQVTMETAKTEPSTEEAVLF